MSSGEVILLDRARQQYDVPAAVSVAEVVELLRDLGAGPIDFDRYRESLVDEFVDSDLVVVALTLADAVLLQQRATGEERAMFVPDPDEVFDPLEYGPEMVEWTTWSYEISALQRLLVLVERHPSDTDRVGGFRVYGPGQWLRESLWAATGIVPRDPGSPSDASALFGDAFELQGRGRFEADLVRP